MCMYLILSSRASSIGFCELSAFESFQNHDIYRSAALPASKTPVFTAPARKRLQQHLQKQVDTAIYCSGLQKAIHKHAKTCVLPFWLAKYGNNTYKNLVYTVFYCSGSQTTVH